MAHGDLDSDDEDETGNRVRQDDHVVPEDEPSETPPPPVRRSGPPRLGGHSDDDGEIPERYQRRPHKYTTAGLQPERPWKRWCLICLAFLVIIVIMVLLSIFLMKLFDPPEDQDWSDDKVNATDDDLVDLIDETLALLPKSSAFLDDVCAEDKLSGDTRAACEQACAPALECCNPYASGNSTCYQEQVAGCVTYSQCHALEGIVDPAYNDLDRVCSMEAIEISPADCELACNTMSCCYTDVDSCVAENFQACLDYSPCQNLKAVKLATAAAGQYIAAAGATLEDECGNKDPQCVRGCQEALCCSDANSACYRDNFVACLTYATCNQHPDATTRIAVAPIHSIVPAAPANLRDVCLQAYVSSKGPSECQTACEPADCCFTAGATSCFGTDPLGCMEYRGCSILRQST